MLKQSEKFEDKFKTNLVTNSLLELGDDISDEAKGKGRKFVSRFIEAGVAHYRDFGDVLITKETLDKFINTMIGCPVIITHKDIDDNNADKERVGVVSEVWYNSADGWYYCSGIIWDKKAIDLVKNQGWSVSCTYDFESDNQAKTHNGKKIDREFTNGEFLHLALVDNPRYERANIVMNAKEKEFITVGEGEEKHVIPLDYITKGKEKAVNPIHKTEPAKNPPQKKEQEYQPSKKQDDKKTADEFEKKLDEAKEKYRKVDFNNKEYSLNELIKKGFVPIKYSGSIYKDDHLTYLIKNEERKQSRLKISQDEYEKLQPLYIKQINDMFKGVDYGKDLRKKSDKPMSIIERKKARMQEDIKSGFYKAKNNQDERKENIIMTALNDLENFVRGIVENACKKEVENEKDDKRKLIDEVAGMMKSAGADDELIRTAIAKMEKIAYEKSEADTADNNCKNEKEEVKEEMKEEKEADKAEPLEEKEEEKDEKEDEFKKEKEIVKNSSDENDTSAIDKTKEIVYNSNSTVKSSYVTRDERLKLGDNY